MKMENENKSVTVFSLGISTEVANELKYGFIAERESKQESIEAEARARKVDKLQVYAEKLAIEAIAARFERYEAKKEKVMQQAVKVLVAGGTTEEKARQMLGLGN